MIKNGLTNTIYYYGLLFCCLVICSPLRAARQFSEEYNSYDNSQRHLEQGDVDIGQLMQMMRTMMDKSKDLFQRQHQAIQQLLAQQKEYEQRLEDQQQQLTQLLAQQQRFGQHLEDQQQQLTQLFAQQERPAIPRRLPKAKDKKLFGSLFKWCIKNDSVD